jgi:hypothetical protein
MVPRDHDFERQVLLVPALDLSGKAAGLRGLTHRFFPSRKIADGGEKLWL